LNVDHLREEVLSVYERVANEPSGDFHFHRGSAYAVGTLGYDPVALASLPSDVVASFAGMGNPHTVGPIERGETVLDIGCGSGVDLLLAAEKVGPEGKAIGVDITEAMRARASAAAKTLGLDHVDVREGDALALPIEDESIDVVISNGVLNLAPNKARAFREIARVLKPEGRLQVADIVVKEELSLDIRNDIDLWTG
jgi:SAM-dependent methyltransferase